MPHIASFNELLVAADARFYDAEKRLTKAIPKLGQAATNDELRSALETPSRGNGGSRVASRAGVPAHSARRRKPSRAPACAALSKKATSTPMKTTTTTVFATRRSSVRRSVLSTTRLRRTEPRSRTRGCSDATKSSICSKPRSREEKAADKKLTEIAEGTVNLEAAHETEMNERPTGMRSMMRGRSTSGERTMAHSRTRRNNRSNSRSSKRKRARK